MKTTVVPDKSAAKCLNRPKYNIEDENKAAPLIRRKEKP